MKILVLLHALLKEIQECLSSKSQEFFAAGGLHLCEAAIDKCLPSRRRRDAHQACSLAILMILG